MLFFYVSALQCGEVNIEHCSECGVGTNKSFCITCEDKYFPFLKNSLCLPCDDKYYGEEGCTGKCSIINPDNDFLRNVYCDNCKTGYFNFSNSCYSCKSYKSGCLKCTYNNIFKDTYIMTNYINCMECDSSQYKLIKSTSGYGTCSGCSISSCAQSKFEKDSCVCEKCILGYYLKDNNCEKCNWIIQSEGRLCEICSDDLTYHGSELCYCFIHYTEGDSQQCVKCPENCYGCSYNSQDKTTKCYQCDIGYIINSKGNCLSCGDNCNYCTLDNNENPICLSCKSGFNLNYDNNCLKCGDFCSSCIKSKDNIIECTKCNNNYGLYPNKTCVKCPGDCKNCYWKEDKSDFLCSECLLSSYALIKDDKCVMCNQIDELGGNGCLECYNDKSSKDNIQYKCTKCYNNNYAYIDNQYKCLPNSDTNIEYLSGCINAIYNSNKKKYECLKCNSNYIYILNEKKCLKPEEANLNSFCKEANNTGNEQKSSYSCINCQSNNYVKVSDNQNKVNCSEKKGDLIYCLEAIKDENGKIKCKKCLHDYLFQEEQNKCTSMCDADSFLKYNWCRKCDDIYYGNPGCLAKSGCSYNDIYDRFSCNKCKEDYYKLFGMCYPCTMISGCKKCNQTNVLDVKCVECYDGYILNNSICELMKCKENIEITPGCLVCKDKLEQYKQLSKCQFCKEGYFKTKDESCVYCKSMKNGGPGCELCEYAKNSKGKDNNEIRCSYCPEGSRINKDGKCLKCKEELGVGCSDCIFIINEEDNIEKLICIKCENNYYLTSNGYCNYSGSYSEYIPNCGYISNTKLLLDNDNSNYQDIIYTNIGIKIKNYAVYSVCSYCDSGFYLKDGKCIELNFDDCTLSSIYLDSNRNSRCQSFCYDHTMIYYNIYVSNKKINVNPNKTNVIINNKEKKTLYNIANSFSFTEYYETYNMYHSLNMNFYMCLGNLGTGGKYNPKNLKKCVEAEYNEIDDTYTCMKCSSGYLLDNKTKICRQTIKETIYEHPGLNCEIENIGDDSQPLYSCKNCYNKNDILVRTESGAKFCDSNYYTNGCTEIIADTTYAKNNYICTNCSKNYILYVSQYYQKKICQYINNDIIRSHDFNVSLFSEIEKDNIEAKNDVCEDKKLFTPDNINCFACNSQKVGMPGCKGSCTFSIYSENYLECEENGCKTGYIEESKGVCSTCNSVNEGCIECHYDNNYPTDYKGLKRKRRFVCEQCEKGYLLIDNNTCYNCHNLGLSNCEKCNLDEIMGKELVCSQCKEGYFLTEAGECTQCYNNKVRVKGNKCVSCKDREYGGIDGCLLCISNNNKIISCIKCDTGFMLYENNGTCLRISDNIELYNFTNCIKIKSVNGILSCSQCQKNSYILLTDKNENNGKCVSIDFLSENNIMLNEYCEKTINIGTEDKPIYSCEKCLDNSYIKSYYGSYINIVKFIFESNNTAYCDISYYNKLFNCSEAIISKENNQNIKCSKCDVNNVLTYDKNSYSFICKYHTLFSSNCEVKNCKTCQEGNNYLCEICLSDKYEPNSITGSCVKKSDKVPSIIWKDIFGLKIYEQIIINGKEYIGPFVKLRGLTNSQINEGHAFMFYLYFEIINLNDRRKLQEENSNEMKVPMLCEIEEGNDENMDEANMVEYYCMGDLSGEESFELAFFYEKAVKIEEDTIKNKGKLIPSNLNDLILDNIFQELPSDYLQKLVKTSMFRLNEIVNHTSEKYEFTFSKEGELIGDGDINNINIEFEIHFAEVDEKTKCNLNIDENKKGILNCKINLEKYKNIKVFSFKLSECEYEDKTIFLSQINEIYLIINYKDDNTKYYIIGGAGGAILIIIIVVIIIKNKKPEDEINTKIVNKNNRVINPIKIAKKINKRALNKNIKTFTKKIKKPKKTNKNDSSKTKMNHIKIKKNKNK